MLHCPTGKTITIKTASFPFVNVNVIVMVIVTININAKVNVKLKNKYSSLHQLRIKFSVNPAGINSKILGNLTLLGDWLHMPQIIAVKAYGACPHVESYSGIAS